MLSTDADTHCHTNRYTGSNRGSRVRAGTHGNSDASACIDGCSDSNTRTYSNGDADSGPSGDSHTGTYGNTYSPSHSDSAPYCDTHIQPPSKSGRQ